MEIMKRVQTLSNFKLLLSRHYSKLGTKTFVDNVRVYARGGGGGQGLPQYGGVGGKGGSIYVVADENTSLKKLTQHKNGRRYVGTSGGNSRPRTLLGKTGKDVEILVPPGVEVTNEAGRKLGEVNFHGEKLLIVKGGIGGGPWNNFCGQKGVSLHVRLDLKLIADIGLVGFPNAGKSTLLKALSRASPKIASYPFTTIQPQIGMMEYADHRQIRMADLPGLIEGAHLNVGLGYRFLKHVERTKVLLFVVDIHGFRLSLQHPFRSALDTVLLLNKELELYKSELLSKPAVLVLNKIDVEDPDINVDDVVKLARELSEYKSELDGPLQPNQYVQFDDVIPISAREKHSTDYLKERLRLLIDIHADEAKFNRSTSTDLDTRVRTTENIVQKGPVLV